MIGYITSYRHGMQLGETYKVKGSEKVDASYGYKVYYSMDNALRYNVTQILKSMIEVLGATDKLF